MSRRLLFCIFVLVFLFSSVVIGETAKGKSENKKPTSPQIEKKADDVFSSGTFSGLKFRGIGPAVTSGRIADFAVNPNNPSEYYVGVAAGNVWKTINSGITWTPVFDKYGSWSIADVEIDPNNTHVIWVGTGEYNSQRAIGYGDGVYRSEDGGKTWKNMGLEKSEHIGRIVIDPRNSHVYAAAQGPLWGPGGDRGLFKTTDNGKTWKAILTISENTGINDVVLDPRNPDIVYATSYQRRRHVFTVIDGGPEAAIYKSTDAGTTWKKVTDGLPGGDLGRIGLAISPVNPDVIYAVVEAERGKGGFFRSTNRGETWEKRGSYVPNSSQYYNRIFADPKDVDKVYSMDVVSRVSDDGGKTFRAIGNRNRHVDDHAFWIDPRDTRHLLIGGDGGIYETFDSGEYWHFKANLPVTQFYHISADNSLPFYYVFGGTQDNNSLGGPSRSISDGGVLNTDWIFTQGGDGFQSQIDPENPDIIYAQAQYGELVRYDKKNSERISIKPMEQKGEAFRWNWNSPLIISPHSATRLYFAANILFRSDDRGNTWKRISGDLTRQLDRNKIPVMGKIQSPEAVAKSASTSLYGNITALSESPVKEGLIYVGTDDGLIQVTENGGEKWTRIETFPGVPDKTYVSYVKASLFDANTVYAAFDGRKNSDLKPYLLKSTDCGKTWISMVSNLPARGTVYCLAQDHIKKDLLFVGTEFGAFFSIDEGKKWIQMKSGIPTQAVYDIVIQKRENDLILATFGRGIYILDNYSPLRDVTPSLLEKPAHIFPVKDSLSYIKKGKLYGQGETLYSAPNPPYGAVFTYYLKNSLKTLKDKRKEEEKKQIEKGLPIEYPTTDRLRAEDNEIPPYLLFTITDETGKTIRRIKTEASSGIQRVTWNLSFPSTDPVSLVPKVKSEEDEDNSGGDIEVLPGKYFVSLSSYCNGVFTQLVEAQPFKVVALNNSTLPAKDRKEVLDFLHRASELSRVVEGTIKLTNDQLEKVKYFNTAIIETGNASTGLLKDIEALEKELKEIQCALTGDTSIKIRNGSQPPSIQERIQYIMYAYSASTSDLTQEMRNQYTICAELLEPQLAKLKKLVETDIKKMEATLEALGAPWTPNRIPELKK